MRKQQEKIYTIMYHATILGAIGFTGWNREQFISPLPGVLKLTFVNKNIYNNWL